MSAFLVLVSLVTLILALILRAVFVIIKIQTCECSLESPRRSLRTMLCMGSGGHTSEILRLVKKFNSRKYCPRMYVVADSDKGSCFKVDLFEKEVFEAKEGSEYFMARIPRSRKVHQPFTTSVITTLYASLYAFRVVYGFKPDVVFCNGPGTCVPICITAFLLRCLWISECRIVFVESICRVRTLSLTGKILQWFADIFVIQWPYLQQVSPRAKYFGRLT